MRGWMWGENVVSPRPSVQVDTCCLTVALGHAFSIGFSKEVVKASSSKAGDSQRDTEEGRVPGITQFASENNPLPSWKAITAKHHLCRKGLSSLVQNKDDIVLLQNRESSPELQAGGKDGTRDVLLSTACMFSSMLTFQRLGTLGKALERKNPQNSIQASRPREETAKSSLVISLVVQQIVEKQESCEDSHVTISLPDGALLVEVNMNECMSKEFTVCPQTTESFECVFIYMKRSVVCSQTTKLGFGILLDFLSGKDIDVCAESDVIRGASLQAPGLIIAKVNILKESLTDLTTPATELSSRISNSNRSHQRTTVRTTHLQNKLSTPCSTAKRGEQQSELIVARSGKSSLALATHGYQMCRRRGGSRGEGVSPLHPSDKGASQYLDDKAEMILRVLNNQD
ncbi:hypothetical protein Anapl_02940 [Anas platyrhynchos]|uniref:Uncharacterized protein n=1 Tax=Anas platyrhynchos TaxID=8839 RepID=R0JN85_ANAPL|nr:hypothetical protein Anapl_02940 [Anas platyrhynchos]